MPLKATEVFTKMESQLPTHGAAIVAKVGAIYLWEIREKKGGDPEFITVDLKNGNGKITMGKGDRPDATFVMLDDDFMKLVNGKLKA